MATDAPAVARPAPELSEEDSKAVKSALRWSKLSAGVLVATTVFQVATGSGFGALLSAVLLVMTLCCGVRGLRQGNGTKVLWHARAHACCACLIVVFVIPAIFIALAAYNCACSVECRQMFLPNPADFAPAGNASGFAPGGFNRSSGASPSGFRNGFAPAQHHGGPPRADEMRPAGHPDKPAGHKPAEDEPHREIAPAANSNHRSGPPRPNGGAPAYGSARSGSHHESSGWHSAWHSHSHDDEDEAAFSGHSGRDSGKRDDRPRGGFGGRWSPHGDEDEDLTREEVAAFVAEATEKMDMMCTVSNGMSAPAVFLAIVVSTLLAGIHVKTSRAGFAAASRLPSGRSCGGPGRVRMMHTAAGLTPARLEGGSASTAPAPQAPAQRPAGPGAHAAAAGDDYPFSAPAAAPASGGFMSRIRGMVAQQRGYATVETFDDAPPRAAPVGAGTAAVAPPQQAATAPPPVSYEEYLRLVAASS
ncbi:hypothetical protein FNF28_04498 [Cafeteria roenbergensis]|uniref:Uncharacterized protein n=1 Tax=Cafeteria roenbergensis TaxID=33653 RepID=A0A5A8DBJ3_CAFRO|nr:hypothetical protein FNF28_04498 [Cafeteria roenbergensis]